MAGGCESPCTPLVVCGQKKPASRAGRVMGIQILSLKGATGGAYSQNSSNL